MLLDNALTARCKKCGWRKQFRPGVEYSADDFKCNCKETPKPKPRATAKKVSNGKQQS